MPYCLHDLIIPSTGEWNLTMIKHHLPQYEGLIRKLVPSSLTMEDEMVRLPEQSGTYSTKIGFALAKLNIEGDREEFRWHKCIWNVKCSTKLKQFLWKLKNNALVVSDSH